MYSYRTAFSGLAEEKKSKPFNFKRQARFADNLERERLRLFKTEMGTPGRDDFYEALRFARS